MRIRELDREIRDIPIRKKDRESALNGIKQTLQDSETELKNRQAELKKLDLEVECNKEKISKLRTQQIQLKTNSEFKAMESEISAFQQSISGIEDKQIGVMEGIEAAKAEVERQKSLLKAEEGKIAIECKQLDQRQQSVEEELNKIKAVRIEAAKEVLPAWLAVYDKIIGHKEPALVLLDDGICGGCHLKLAPSIMHEAKKRISIVTCGYCGRLLY